MGDCRGSGGGGGGAGAEASSTRFGSQLQYNDLEAISPMEAPRLRLLLPVILWAPSITFLLGMPLAVYVSCSEVVGTIRHVPVLGPIPSVLYGGAHEPLATTLCVIG